VLGVRRPGLTGSGNAAAAAAATATLLPIMQMCTQLVRRHRMLKTTLPSTVKSQLLMAPGPDATSDIAGCWVLGPAATGSPQYILCCSWHYRKRAAGQPMGAPHLFQVAVPHCFCQLRILLQGSLYGFLGDRRGVIGHV
jgi:hypothetical protein